jgi:hypothetical protein
VFLITESKDIFAPCPLKGVLYQKWIFIKSPLGDLGAIFFNDF